MVRGMVKPFKMLIFYDFDVEADMTLVREMIEEVEVIKVAEIAPEVIQEI